MKYITALVGIILIFPSCVTTSDGITCTEEFRSIGVTIVGLELNEYYTLRKSTEDTIRINTLSAIDNWYPILDDNFQSIIANDQETFIFIGIVDNVEVINEEYVIKADECHIDLVSGKTTITL